MQVEPDGQGGAVQELGPRALRKLVPGAERQGALEAMGIDPWVRGVRTGAQTAEGIRGHPRGMGSWEPAHKQVQPPQVLSGLAPVSICAAQLQGVC